MKIGSQARELRQQRQMTLKQVAQATGLSIPFLSQLENGKTSLTLESLKKISEAFSVSPAYFFQEQENDLRSKNRDPVDNTQFAYTDLARNFPNPAFQPLLVTIQPGESEGSPISHAGQEFLYVLKGVLHLLVGDRTIELHPNDSYMFNAIERHYWYNRSSETIQFLYVSTA